MTLLLSGVEAESLTAIKPCFESTALTNSNIGVCGHFSVFQTPFAILTNVKDARPARLLISGSKERLSVMVEPTWVI